MSDSAAAPAKKAAAKAKKPAKKADHPPVASMVMAAITNLKDRKGSSLAAIKKYIAANNKVDVAKLAPFIRRFLKKAVADGKLVQPKGTGASGSFKLAAKPKVEKPKKKPAAAKKEKKAKKPKTPKKPKAKKATKSPKKPAAKKPAKSPKKAAKKPAKKPAAKKTPKKAAAKKPAKK
jgi:histone H1/5